MNILSCDPSVVKVVKVVTVVHGKVREVGATSAVYTSVV